MVIVLICSCLIGNTVTQTVNSTQPAIQSSSLESYVGTVEKGISLFHNGSAIVEITFQDGRVFIAPEKLAAQANMKIEGTYLILFNASAPETAVDIQEP